MKSTIKDWLKVAVLMLDEVAVVVVALIILSLLGIKITLPVIIVAALLLGALVFFTHKKIIPTFHKKKITGAEGLIGLEGEVIEPLTPVGLVKVGSECWKARAVGENIEAGEEVEILEVNGLKLTVKLKGG